ncbi:hypothetical protein KDL29_09465 [bacterium]|nr:hypothetical protein [bacterium]
MFLTMRDSRQIPRFSLGILLSLVALLLGGCGSGGPRSLYIGDVVLSGSAITPDPDTAVTHPELVDLLNRVSAQRNFHLGSVDFTEGQFEPDYSAMHLRDGWTKSQVRKGGQVWRAGVKDATPEKLSGEGSMYTAGPYMKLTHVIESDDPTLFNLILRGQFNRTEVQEHLDEINPRMVKNAPLESDSFLASFILTGALDGKPFTVEFVQTMRAEFGKF